MTSQATTGVIRKMTDTMNALRDMENKLDEMDEAMAILKMIFENPLSATGNRSDDKDD